MKKLLQLSLMAFLLFSTACGVSQHNIDLEKAEHDIPAGEASPEAKQVQELEQLQTEEQKTQSLLEAFALPNEYAHLDPNGYVPKALFNKTMDFFIKYRSQFKNQNYIGMIDFSQKSSNRRLYVMNMKTGQVTGFLVAHGKNSDSNNDGFATQFSNKSGSLMSSLGAYMTAETYQGKHGLSLRLDGLQSTNSNARSRAVVVHTADYVRPNMNVLGRSFGCPAIEKQFGSDFINKFKGGALLFAATN